MFKRVPKDPHSHGTDKGHVSLLESDSLGMDCGEVGDYSNVRGFRPPCLTRAR